MRPPLGVYAVSINELQRELHDARAAGGGDGTEGARVAAGIRVAIVRGVEQVEALRTKLHFHRFGKGEILKQRKVVVGVARTANEISPRTAWNRIAVALSGCIGERTRIEPFCDYAHVARQRRVLAGHQVWPQARIIGVTGVRDDVNRCACVE